MIEEEPTIQKVLPCPIGSKSHTEHDDTIRELQKFKELAELTPTLLTQRIIKLEKHILKLDSKFLEDLERLRKR